MKEKHAEDAELRRQFPGGEEDVVTTTADFPEKEINEPPAKKSRLEPRYVSARKLVAELGTGLPLKIQSCFVRIGHM